jgi:hypothetical protein
MKHPSSARPFLLLAGITLLLSLWSSVLTEGSPSPTKIAETVTEDILMAVPSGQPVHAPRPFDQATGNRMICMNSAQPG